MLTIVLTLLVSQSNTAVDRTDDHSKRNVIQMADIFDIVEEWFERLMDILVKPHDDELVKEDGVLLGQKEENTMSVSLVIDGVTRDQLLKIMPGIPRHLADTYLPLLNAAMREYEINTTLRVSAFLGQLAHESAELKYFEEIASGVAYEGRYDLGNVYPGDGRRFKGRGPIQLTGRANYRDYGKELGLDLMNNPELAASPSVGFRIAGAFWKRKGLNALADAGEYKKISAKINGINKKTGEPNGLDSRIKYYTVAKEALGVK